MIERSFTEKSNGVERQTKSTPQAAVLLVSAAGICLECFGNLVALHIDHQEQSQVISTGETLDMLLTQHSDPDRFLSDGAGRSTDSLQPVH